jgi:hypothetical protein
MSLFTTVNISFLSLEMKELHWTSLFSYWVFAWLILYYANLIHINPFPIYLAIVLFLSLLFLRLQPYGTGYPPLDVSIPVLLTTFILDFLPILILPWTFRDWKFSVGFFVVYLVFIYLQKMNFWDIYEKNMIWTFSSDLRLKDYIWFRYSI